MKALYLLIPLVSAVLLSGCPQPPPGHPGDFSFEYSSASPEGEWSTFYHLVVDSSGNATFTKKMRTALEKTYTFAVTEEQRIEIYGLVVENDFFSLLDNYGDPSAPADGWEYVTVTANSKTKKVARYDYYSVPAFDIVLLEIMDVLSSEFGENAFAFDPLKEDCDGKKTYCEGKDTVECNDWKAFCDWQEEQPELTLEYCEPLENREECIDYCTDNNCSEELCEALLFEPDDCTECSPGCCSFCGDLDSCAEHTYCRTVWVHPTGESWQFGGCENLDFCMDTEEACEYLFYSYQGYSYISAIEEDQNKALEYSALAALLEEFYNEGCE